MPFIMPPEWDQGLIPGVPDPFDVPFSLADIIATNAEPTDETGQDAGQESPVTIESEDSDGWIPTPKVTVNVDTRPLTIAGGIVVGVALLGGVGVGFKLWSSSSNKEEG